MLALHYDKDCVNWRLKVVRCRMCFVMCFYRKKLTNLLFWQSVCSFMFGSHKQCLINPQFYVDFKKFFKNEKTFIGLWAPYQAEFGTNKEIQYFIRICRLCHTQNLLLDLIQYVRIWRVIELKPDPLRYGWRDSPCLKRWRTRRAGSSINVQARLVCLSTS